MKEGKVEEFGTHAELMAKEGEYCKMYNRRSKPVLPGRNHEAQATWMDDFGTVILDTHT